MKDYKETGIPVISYLWDKDGFPLFQDTEEEEKLTVPKERFEEIFDFSNEVMFIGKTKEVTYASLETVGGAYRLVKFPIGTEIRGDVFEFNLEDSFFLMENICAVI